MSGMSSVREKLLAVETSTSKFGVALVDEGHVVFEIVLDASRRHGELLLPFCLEALERSETRLEDLCCLAVSVGPGSFTGLRIGCATVQGLAQALGVKVALVRTFDVIRRQCSFAPRLAIVQGKARGQTVGAFYTKTGDLSYETIFPETAVSFQEMAKRLEGQRQVFVAGDAAVEFCSEAGMSNVFPVGDDLGFPRPGVVGLLGLEIFKAGKAVLFNQVVPFYVRASSAEKASQLLG